jgi:DNA repair protein RadC
MKPNKNWRTKLQGSEFRIMRLSDAPMCDVTMDTPEILAAHLFQQLPRSIIFRPDVENLIVVNLNTRKNPIGWEIISHGTLDTLLAHAREVFKSAIIANAAGIILIHNHPSGDPTPSDADIKVTRDLIRSGQILKIDVVDHIVLGRPGYDNGKGWASLREMGYFAW